MPYAAPRPCVHPGCGSAAAPGSSRCLAHQRPRVYTPRPAPAEPTAAATLRGSVRWQRLRAYHRRISPLCVLCGRPATHSHHIEPVAKRPELAFKLENLAAVCTSCHGWIEGQERTGQPTAHLFAGKTLAPAGLRAAEGEGHA